ncbi:MAG: hypothetical protein NVSMB56_19090 [Pyrinomonadaceae bacterium]
MIKAKIFTDAVMNIARDVKTTYTREKLRRAQNPVDADWLTSNIALEEPETENDDWNNFDEIRVPPDVDPVENPELVERRHFDECDDPRIEDRNDDDDGNTYIHKNEENLKDSETRSIDKNVDTPKTDVVESQRFSESQKSESVISAALDWAAQGVSIFPLHTPDDDGVCSCKEGAKCGNTGKHPRTFNGLKDATADEKTIRKWLKQFPNTNFGGVMGDAAGIIAVDIDPKNGGDLSLTDLIEAFSDEWTNTRTARTGSGGYHFFFKHPKGLNLRNTAGKIAPGIDTRANGGYVVLAPSLHASGKRYEIINDCEPLPLPEWLLERLTADRTKQAYNVIHFQEKRPRGTVGGGIIPDGERNKTLFKIGCAIWGKSEAAHLPDLHDQLLEVNAQRCSPPLEGAEVAKLAANISARYARGVHISTTENYRKSSSESCDQAERVWEEV